MKTAHALILSACLAGCATTQTSKDVSPPLDFTDSAGKHHFITGEIIKNITQGSFETTWSYRLAVAIDGEKFIDGGLDPHTFSGTVPGKYGDKSAIASCIGTRRSVEWTDVRCEIAIDGNRAGALTF